MTRRWLCGLVMLALAAGAACESPGSGGGSGPYWHPDASAGHDVGGDLSAVPDTPFDGNAHTDTTGVDSPAPPDTGPPTPDTPPVGSDWVDPQCIDGQYSETLPATDADLSAEKAAYSPQDPIPFIHAALQKRYPVGDYVLSGGMSSPMGGGNCVEMFLSDPSSADSVISEMSTLVHECGHMFDISEGGFMSAVYVLTDTTRFTCQPSGGFNRGLIIDDSWGADYPACAPGQYNNCDFYADTYLTGQMGSQGFDSLLEEVTQYINSLATAYAFHDHYSPMMSTTERDGILTFLWYLERYLYLARTEYASTYQELSGDACWREAILTIWGRAWLFLEASEGIAPLGMNDAKLEELVVTPELLAEIDRLRDAAGCP